MNSKRKLLQTPLAIAEDVKLQLMAKVDSFLASDEDSYTFPASLSKTERQFIHGYSVQKGLDSQSNGGYQNRRISIFHIKQRSNVNSEGKSNASKLSLSNQARKVLYKCFSTLPRKNAKSTEVPGRDDGQPRVNDRRQFGMSTLTNGVACVPPPPGKIESTLANSRKSLPIFESRQLILDTIAQNQVIILVGETGSGKTTQVPQYLLEDATANNACCRIVCTQPRRLSALSVADRVAFERSEETGGTVGFQIRLESRTCPRSNLIYCTNGILVRCLMTGDHAKTFANITHIILDEIHERDKNADFLLITIRDVLKVNPQLKLILMSATIDTSLFSEYFGNCPQIYVPGRTFPVQELFLEDILRLTKFKKNEVDMLYGKMRGAAKAQLQTEAPTTPKQEEQAKTGKKIDMDDETRKFVDDLLERCLKEDFQENFDQFIFMVETEEVDIDYQHSETSINALMLAATRGCVEVLQTLLSLGADVNVKTSNGYTAADLAAKMNNQECVELLLQSQKSKATEESPSKGDVPRESTDPKDSSEYVDVLLDVYNNSFNATVAIDRFLILDLIEFIHQNLPMGSVLVFLPGYEDITTINGLIMDKMNERKLKPNIRLYTLHSNMKVNDQKAVFKPAPYGCRKIILSTNIAETSITIDDVVYVIDCGKVKQTNFDVHTGTNCLETVPISKACAKQRAGRAGRVTTGICYKLFSRKQYEWMSDFTLPELMRVPLTDICLAAKLISPHEAIQDFLGKAVTPPLRKCIQRSVEVLKKIGALKDSEEEEVITNLGIVLADLPVDAHLGKMIIYAIILKCVDPILTIVSALSVKSIFTLPPDKKGRDDAKELKYNLSEGTVSDHLVLIRVFQKWLEHSTKRSASDFCQKYYLNAGSLQTICGMRSLILGHLRANRLIKSNGKGNIHDLNVNSKNWAVVKACLVAGLYPNVCEKVKKGKRHVLRGDTRETIHVHSQSVLKVTKNTELEYLPTNWLVFEEKVRTAGQAAAIDCSTAVTTSAIALFAGNLALGDDCIHAVAEDEDGEEDDWNGGNSSMNRTKDSAEKIVHMKINKWITLQLEEESAVGLLELRRLFTGLLMRMLNGHENFHSRLDANDNLIISTVAEVLTAEDKADGMMQPKGIGDRPQAVHLDFSADINFGIHDATGAATAGASGMASGDGAAAAVDCEVTTTVMDMGRMSINENRRNQWGSSGGRGRGAQQHQQRRNVYNSHQQDGAISGRGYRANRGRGASQGFRGNATAAPTKRYFVVRVENRNIARAILHGSSFHALEFLKRELASSMNQTFVIVFSLPAQKEFFGCAVVDPQKRQGNKLVVDAVSEMTLYHSCYRSWTAAMDQQVVTELNAADGEYMYNYFSGH